MSEERELGVCGAPSPRPPPARGGGGWVAVLTVVPRPRPVGCALAYRVRTPPMTLRRVVATLTQPSPPPPFQAHRAWNLRRLRPEGEGFATPRPTTPPPLAGGGRGEGCHKRHPHEGSPNPVLPD